MRPKVGEQQFFGIFVNLLNWYRKHRKRHDKPYGCTFPPCSRTFGSKNDWKRHESFQHLKVETWQCDEHKKSSTDACNKAFNRCESFKNHLSRDHEIKDPEDVKKKLERCRKASAYSPYFWCGFCLENIDVPEQSAWLLTRCNHIDDHFCGRNGHGKKNSVEWIHEDAMADVFVGRQSRLNSDPSKHTNATASKSKSIVTTEKQTPKQAHTSGPILWLCVSIRSISGILPGLTKGHSTTATLPTISRCLHVVWNVNIISVVVAAIWSDIGKT